MKKNSYDIIVVGAGAAGLTAAIFAARRGLSVLVVSRDVGGQAATTTKIENYPGHLCIDGRELMETFYKQAKGAGADFLWGEIVEFFQVQDGFQVNTSQGNLFCQALVLAFGLVPRDLGVPGEEKFKDTSVVYSAVDRDDVFKDNTVVVVGGGNSAFTGVLHIAKIAKKVFLVHRRQEFRAEDVLVEQAQKNTNIEFVLNAKITQIIGKEKVEQVIILKDGQEKIINADAVYVAIGFGPQSDWIKGVIKRTDKKEIITAGTAFTSLDGVFAAGDATNNGWKQLVVAAGEGCKAGLSAARYVYALQKKEFKAIDWN